MPDRVVIDTNTHVSAAILLGSIPFQAVEKAIRSSQILFSLDTWHELEDVLLREKFDRYKAIEVRYRYLKYLSEIVETISVHTSVSVCRHPKDDKFLELAIDGRVDLIVTGDKDLLVLHSFQGIAIITPAAYLAL